MSLLLRQQLMVLVVAVWALVPGARAASDLISFDVRHAVEWTRVRPLGAQRFTARAPSALFAPDHSRFLLHTRRGDVARNANIEQLWVFETRMVQDYYLSSASNQPPRGRLLAEVEVRHDWGEVSGVTWIDGDTVGFLAEGDNGASQIFIANIARAASRQLTRADNGVASFAVGGDRVLYYAFRAPRQPLVQAVDDRIIYSIFMPPVASSEAIELFSTSIASGDTRRVDLPAARIALPYRSVWVSPSGRYGVVLAPPTNTPGYWAEYHASSEEMRYNSDGRAAAPDSLTAMLSQKLRYMLVDLVRNEVRPLLDAPSGSTAARMIAPMAAYWSEGERSVVVAHTYLPLAVHDQAERKRRSQGPAIAEIDLESGAVSRIAWEEVGGGPTASSPGPIAAINWDAARQVLVLERRSGADVTQREFLRKTRRTWRRDAALQTPPTVVPLDIEVRQSLNERPKVYAIAGPAAAKLLMDPNPAADEFAFGRVELVTWSDPNKLSWKAGLVYPTDYVAGKRYPLVVQLHGFRDDRFLMSGTGDDTGTAAAAQILANAGFVVLQVADHPGAFTGDEREARLVAQGWRAGVQALVERGLVDQQKIGIIAFSRTCLQAIQFMADFPEIAAAVTLADGPWWGYEQQLMLTNYPSSIVAAASKMTGGTLDPAQLQEWFDRNPLYSLPKARAAVRIEAMGADSLVALWETYSVLQNAGRAVDMIYFPEGSHNVMKPLERMGSQGGNVDWFRFWLQGEDDPDPAKAQQYERWHKLRARVSH